MDTRDIPATSMGKVRERDKAGWLALFAEDATVEDPVGPSAWDPEGRGRRGKAEIAAFYDMFSAAQTGFDFEIREMYTCGDEVAAAVSMHIIGLDGTRHTTSAINVYRRSPDGLIQSLRSFWEAQV